MRDKKDAKLFVRTIDRSHPSNIRVVVPPVIDKFLKSPGKVIFTTQQGAVIIYPIDQLERLNDEIETDEIKI